MNSQATTARLGTSSASRSGTSIAPGRWNTTSCTVCADDFFFLCRKLIPGHLGGVTGEYATPDGYFVCQQAPADFAAFDATFPLKEKRKLPGQLFDE